MKKNVFVRILCVSFVSVALLQSCKDKKDEPAPAPVPDQSHTQELDNIAAATTAGWTFKNLSETRNASTFGFVNGGGFPAYSGAGFLYAGYQANAGAGLISAWAISPAVTMQNGDKISFYTRSYNDYSDPANVYADRLQLRVSPFEGSDVGDTSYTVGGFTLNLVDVNPTLSSTLPTAYPGAWTKFEGTIYGLSAPTKGHYAFRYFVDDGGTAGGNSNGIALDKVVYTSVTH
jgi:hypothetical protein